METGVGGPTTPITALEPGVEGRTALGPWRAARE